EFTSEANLRFPVYVLQGEHEEPAKLLVVTPVDDAGWEKWLASIPEELRSVIDADIETAVDEKAVSANRGMLKSNNWAMAVLAPRGLGPSQWGQRTREDIRVRRRFFVLGRTVAEGQIWDTRRAIQALTSQDAYSQARVWVQGDNEAAGIALYAGL